MSQSLFKNRYYGQNRSQSWLSTSTVHNKRFVSQVTSPSYVDLGWLKNILDKIDNFSSVPVFVYQLIALGLLTLGLLLTFQNFTNSSPTDNPISQTKLEIAKTEEKRIWTNTNSIDKLNAKLDYTFAAASIDISNSPEICVNSNIVKSTPTNSNSKTECPTPAKDDKKPTKPTQSITVASGDNISSIAKQYKTTTSSIVELNDLRSNNLKIGQKLLVELTEVTSGKNSVKIAKTR